MIKVKVRTLEEVFVAILKDMPLVEQVYLMNTKEDDLIMYHHGLGRQIRNVFGLWDQNKWLLGDMDLPLATHPDEVSQLIIESLWKKLNKDSNGKS